MEIGPSGRLAGAPTPLAPHSPRRYDDQILLALQARPKPATAQELFTDLRAAGHRAGLATIYRALHALQQGGTIHAIRRSDEIAYRFCTGSQHDHVVCDDCGTVEEVPRAQLERWFVGSVSDGFRPSADPQQIGGVCPRCRELTDV